MKGATPKAVLAAACLSCLLFFGAVVLRGETLDSLKKTYGGINTVEAHFRQQIFLTALKRQRQMEGDFFYKRTKGFLWRYTAPREKIFLYDGSAVWQAEADKPYVTKDKVDRQKMEGSFLDLVDDVARLDSIFTLKGSAREDDMEALDLLPRKEGMLQSARVWVDPKGIVRRIKIVEITGNVNIIEFSAIKVGVSLPDSLFAFKPDGREAIDSRGERVTRQPGIE
jgi:outer membrane lipoprotein-sorting protein